MLSLNDQINKLHLVGPSTEGALRHLGVQTVADLLYYFPREWQDLSKLQKIATIQPNEIANLQATVKKVSARRTPVRKMHLLEALLEDDSGSIKAVWFNQPFLKNSLQENREYYFSGKAQIYETPGKRAELQLQNPTFELKKPETIHTAGIIPVYQLTEGLTQKQLRYWLKLALVTLPSLEDPLPPALRQSLGLVDLKTAIKNIHFPVSGEVLQAARLRLSFDELFLFQLALQSFKQKLRLLPAPQIPFDTELIKRFVAGLPFRLTNSQRLATWEILQDLQKPHPMNRLMEGEVGSGKTVVAGLAMLQVAAMGYQTVLLAPTEILAWQHHQTLKTLFAREPELPLALLTRSRKIGALSDIAAGTTRMIIGTHALLQEHIKFQKIGLLVVDEQHRFGVKQRSQLQNSGKEVLVPHLLSMTATPIPRTLALAFYGDLDISQLKELPMGRKKIITRLVEPENRPAAYEFIRKELGAGRQAYVITPLIEESDTLGVKSAILEAEKLKTEIFPEFQIGLLHGRLPAKGGSASGGKASKEQVMHDFREGKIQILVATSVVEVGVDIANATIMLVENAERFGLAQLHQLRGRVGRSALQSYCLLFAESSTASTRERLEAVVKSNDGFALAERDLELRGPGEIMGLKQSGYIPFRIAKLTNRKLVKLAKLEAEKFLREYPDLGDFPHLKQKVETISRDAHLE